MIANVEQNATVVLSANVAIIVNAQKKINAVMNASVAKINRIIYARFFKTKTFS